jgi:hypothetical protein
MRDHVSREHMPLAGAERVNFLDSIGTSSYLHSMTDLDFLSEAMSSADPAVGLGAVRALGRLQNRLEAIHVANARQHGWTWQAIAEALDLSRQAVHQKYAKRG